MKISDDEKQRVTSVWPNTNKHTHIYTGITHMNTDRETQNKHKHTHTYIHMPNHTNKHQTHVVVELDSVTE